MLDRQTILATVNDCLEGAGIRERVSYYGLQGAGSQLELVISGEGHSAKIPIDTTKDDLPPDEFGNWMTSVIVENFIMG